jgi:hypothetical protein
MSDEIRAAAGLNIPAIREAAAAFEAARKSRTCHNWKTVTGKQNAGAMKAPVYRLDSTECGVLTYDGHWYEPDVRFVELCDSNTLAADVARLCDEIERLRKLLGEQT